MSSPTRMIALAGPDGCGKSTLAALLAKDLSSRRLRVQRIWTRFNNFVSKPLLGLSRISGHNYYQLHAGIRFGYHDFKNLPLYSYLFILLQAIDVNLAVWLRIQSAHPDVDVLIFERGPWDTLADVILDTGRYGIGAGFWYRCYTQIVRPHTVVLHIQRSGNHIISTRPCLAFDRKLSEKIDIYEQLARAHGWLNIDNNGPISRSRQTLLRTVLSHAEHI